MIQYWPFSGITRHVTLRERLIVSLDLGDRHDALELVVKLAKMVGMFKVGRQLFRSGGPDFVREIRRRGAEVFLDLKFHDTPRALLRGALEATRLGVRMFDVQLNGHAETIERTRMEINRLCRAEGLRRPYIVAVAMLAEINRGAPALSPEQPSPPGIESMVEVARQAATVGLDGVFTSAQSAPWVRAVSSRRFIIITPAACMRDPAGAIQFVEGAASIRAGTDYLVGSPVWQAAEPARAVCEIADQIDRDLKNPSPLTRDPFMLRQQ